MPVRKRTNHRIHPAAVICLTGMLLVLPACQSASQPSDNPSGQPSTQIPAATSPAPDHSKQTKSIERIAFAQESLVIAPGATYKPVLHGITKKGDQLDLTGAQGVTYTSSNPELLIVNGDGSVSVAAKAPTGSSVNVTATYGQWQAQMTFKVKYSLDDTVRMVNGRPTVTNMDDLVVVVNKKRELPEDYVPSDLVEPNVPFSFNEKHEKRFMRAEAAAALERLFALAEQDGIKLQAVSGYRSYATQRSIYNYNVSRDGEEKANQFSAKPGQSEHQTGLAMDLSYPGDPQPLEQSFADTEAGKWLAANAHRAGFIIRYPKGKEDITGYAYEPWHVRYVGEEIAKEIYEQGLTLEEWFMDAVPVGAQ